MKKNDLKRQEGIVTIYYTFKQGDKVVVLAYRGENELIAKSTLDYVKDCIYNKKPLNKNGNQEFDIIPEEVDYRKEYHLFNQGDMYTITVKGYVDYGKD